MENKEPNTGSGYTVYIKPLATMFMWRTAADWTKEDPIKMDVASLSKTKIVFWFASTIIREMQCEDRTKRYFLFTKVTIVRHASVIVFNAIYVSHKASVNPKQKYFWVRLLRKLSPCKCRLVYAEIYGDYEKMKRYKSVKSTNLKLCCFCRQWVWMDGWMDLNERQQKYLLNRVILVRCNPCI